MADWRVRKRAHKEFNGASAHLHRGLGLATFWHGAGFTGSGETYLKSRVHVAGLPDGLVLLEEPQAAVYSWFTAIGELKRSDFGVDFNAVLETGGVVVGDKVDIYLEIEAVLNS